MKQSIKIIILVLSIICSAMIVQADDASKLEASLRLPTHYVTMNAEYGTNDWFDIEISDAPDGFDITNGDYGGWCVQKDISMTRGINHAVILHSSYDPNMPDSFKHGNWDKINYIINHKNGSRQSIQDAIWYYVDGDPYPTEQDAKEMVDEAELYGEGFIPQPGQVVAVLLEGVQGIQRTFIEYIIPDEVTLGDLVWKDLNKNGVQEKGEPGISGIEVKLYLEAGTLVKSTTTDGKGRYFFEDVESGNYYLQFKLLNSNYKFSKKDIGLYDELDSDADSSTGKTDIFYLNSSLFDTSLDAGMYKAETEPQPDGNGDTNSGTTPNHEPTADGTAGEPYTEFEKEEVIFDGSRSYDIDGDIVNWSWDFGDGYIAYGEVVNHTYLTPGLYNVSLTVIDDDGAYDVYSTVADIKIENRAPDSPKITGATEGHKNLFYTYSAVSTDPDDDQIKYIFDWGDTESSKEITEFYPSDSPTNAANSWSNPGKYKITVTASDSKLSSSSQITVYIDWVDVADFGHLIDDNSDGVFDTYHSNDGDVTTKAKKIDDSLYLIDVGGDGIWDYKFDSETGELFDYTHVDDYNYLLIILAIVGIIFFITILYIVKKKKH